MLTVDRIENGFAVVEDGENNKIINIPISSLPEGVCEGSVLKRERSGYTLIEDDGQRAAEIKSLFEKLKKKK